MIREYDGAADLPDDMTNLLAVVNLVLLGVPYVHADYGSVDLSTVRPENILVEKNSLGGTTTTYFVPNRTLPLFGCRAARRPAQPLRDIGVPDKIVNVVEEPVRQLVDAGYDRASHENGGATVDSSAATPISLDAALNFNRWQWGITTRPSSTGTTSGAVTERVAERATARTERKPILRPPTPFERAERNGTRLINRVHDRIDRVLKRFTGDHRESRQEITA